MRDWTAGLDPVEVAERLAVVAEAISWLRTPFRDGCDVKGPKGGIDCGMLLVRVYVDTGLVQPFDPRPYPARWFLHRSEERYLEWLEKFAVEIPAAQAKPGDIVIYQHGLTYSHAGIIENDSYIIHAYFKETECTRCERNQIELTT